MTALAPYFLVVIMTQGVHAGGSIASVGEFYSRESCEAAATVVRKVQMKWQDSLIALCLQR